MSAKMGDDSNFSFMNLANKLKNTGNLIGDATSRYAVLELTVRIYSNIPASNKKYHELC